MMGWFQKPAETPDWFVRFMDDLESLHRDLPAEFAGPFKRYADSFEFWTEAPSSAHRAIYAGGTDSDFEYSLGRIWTEGLKLSPDVCRHLLASIDAVIAGRVKEVRDLDSGVRWHVYRLTTRGLDCFSRDSEYSIHHWPWFRRRVRRVSIKTLAPMVTA